MIKGKSNKILNKLRHVKSVYRWRVINYVLNTFRIARLKLFKRSIFIGSLMHALTLRSIYFETITNEPLIVLFSIINEVLHPSITYPWLD